MHDTDQTPESAEQAPVAVDIGLQITMDKVYAILGQMYVEKVAADEARLQDRTLIAQLRSKSSALLEATRSHVRMVSSDDVISAEDIVPAQTTRRKGG
jgi:hypothetical protein